MFAFRLALALGCTVAELGHRLGSAEFREWQAYSRLEPFGERRADARAWALIAHASNLMRDPTKGKAVDLSKILTEWAPPPPKQTPEQVARAVEAYFEHRIRKDAAMRGDE